MGRNERFNTPAELAKHFPLADGQNGGGPVLFYRNGQPYCDTGENQIAAYGISGGGKTQVVVLPYIANCARALESLVVIDPKKELYNKTVNLLKDTHKVYLLDFRSPAKTVDFWNPLKLIYTYIKSGNPELEDMAYDAIYSIGSALMAKSEKDAFWELAGNELVTGIISSLIELSTKPDEINMSSVLKMLREGSEQYSRGSQNYLQTLYKLLPEVSFAKENLATYATAPQDTRNSIMAVAKNGLSAFARSRGLLELISRDTIDIAHLDNNQKPFAIYIVLPDENRNCAALAGIFIKQLSQHFIRLAQTKYNGTLKNRVNFVLEELGSIGSALDNLPNLAVASRSRNIRLLLVLQSEAQLDSLYGKDAEVIRSCIGISYCFSTNNFRTLEEWSRKCGYKELIKNGSLVKTELITPSQLCAMPILTCLVFLGNRYKYIYHFPLFHQSFFQIEERKDDNADAVYERKCIPTFSIKELVDKVKAKEREELFGKRNESSFEGMLGGLPVMDVRTEDAPIKDDVDIQKRLDELQRELENMDKEDE